ncbi:hypothetical protein NP493_36g02018 [Ridgeia piscesae]|uniref:Uncharacterized protein n=1 Tax=Ridgeia piscesae TaxID=27915 RepID=A0AAD9PCM3_RIDPI|nr:hypothetical protein NP493_36g02018 [Ridgeia piscesae]
MSTLLRSRTLKATSTWDRTPDTKNHHKELQRRITADWTGFAKHRNIFNGNIGTCMERQIYNSYVLPAMTYGAEIWAKKNPAAA